MSQTGTLRMTRQRREIVKAVEQSRCHLTADEVYGIVRRKLPRISLGTVYRNLDALAERNILKKIEFCGGQRRYETNLTPHYHLICEDCGCLADLPMGIIDKLESACGHFEGFEIRGYKLIFFGFCENCADDGRRKSKQSQAVRADNIKVL